MLSFNVVCIFLNKYNYLLIKSLREKENCFCKVKTCMTARSFITNINRIILTYFEKTWCLEYSHLDVHMRTVVTSLGGYLWQCTICDKIVKTKNNLKEHIEGQHLDNVYPCTECDKILTSKGALRMHMHRNHRLKMGLNEIKN